MPRLSLGSGLSGCFLRRQSSMDRHPQANMEPISVEMDPLCKQPETAEPAGLLDRLQQKTQLVSSTIRHKWENEWQFLFSIIGLSVGIGNMWRFPYLAHENGGGAFLIPYFTMLLLAGQPIYFMELVMGQFGGSPLIFWKCVPMLKGIGYAMIFTSAATAIYYNVIMSYTLYYLVHSFQSELPWTRCDPEWSKDSGCVVRRINVTLGNGTKSASQVFWERQVLDLSPDIGVLGPVKWDLAVFVLISWIIVIACSARGIKSSGKVVYFTATFPFLILASLLIVAVAQPGAWTGIAFLLKPDWRKLFTVRVWHAAATQVFYSLSICSGSLIAYSSYNNFREDVFHDATIVSIIDTVTSLIAALIAFSILGAMSYDLNVDLNEVIAEGGPVLAAVVFPEALSRLPLPQLWSVLFFVMTYLLALDTEFAFLECIVTSTADAFPVVNSHRSKFKIGIGISMACTNLLFITRGGPYFLRLIDHFGSSVPLVYIGLAECIGVMWVYGYEEFAFDLNFMMGRQLGWYSKVTLKYTAPIVVLCVAMLSVFKIDTIADVDEKYEYPVLYNVVGWSITAVILSPILLLAALTCFKQTDGSIKERLQAIHSESPDWGPVNEYMRTLWRSKRQKRSQ